MFSLWNDTAHSVYTFNHNLTPSIANDVDISAAYIDIALFYSIFVWFCWVQLSSVQFGRQRFSIGWFSWRSLFACLFATFFALVSPLFKFERAKQASEWANVTSNNNRQLNPNIKGDEIKLNNKNILWSHNLYLCDNVLRFAEEWSKSKCCFIWPNMHKHMAKYVLFTFFSLFNTQRVSLFATFVPIWLGIFPLSIHFHKHFMK